jgi:hypothetical protein
MRLSREQIEDALLLSTEQRAAAVRLGEMMESMRLAIGQSDTPEELARAMYVAANGIVDAWEECFATCYDPDEDVTTMGNVYRSRCVAAELVDAP